MKWIRRFSGGCSAARRLPAVALVWLFPALLLASPAAATLKQVTVDPATPASCDSVTITAAGDLPNSCYEIVGAEIRGPELIPCMRPGPCPSRFVVDITVREPNPLILPPCLLQTPYTRSFAVGKLPAGEYLVTAHERVLPFAADSTDSIVAESFANATFTVRPDSTCASIPGCYTLGFTPDRAGQVIPIDPFCTVSAPPGGTACLDLTLANSSPVGGLQTVLQLSEPDSLPAETFLNAVSVDPIGRAAGFQVGWTPDGSRTRLLLYSTNAASIAPGEGPVVRICYSVPSGMAPQRFRILDTATLVSDPEGISIPACPMRFWIPAFICVGTTACDVNGDGVSDVLDIIRIVRCALATPADSLPACPDSIAARADCNSDGAVDIRDVICCVRKILGIPLGSIAMPPLAVGPEQTGGNAIGFDGPVRWINAVEGKATIRVDVASDWGGTQFWIDTQGAPVRVRGLRLVDAGTAAQLEWTVDESGIARVMIFTTSSGTRSSRSYNVEIALERAASGTGSLHLWNYRAGTSAGAEAQIVSFAPTLDMNTPAAAAPTLLGARPNPTSGVTEIGFALPADGKATLRIYDVAGRLVRTLAEGPMTAGVHRARWDGLDARGRAARSGIYFANLTAGPTIRSERILLLR
ncbi:MAG TPA: FlgD immunoglobulin-like domain containing protein [Methylomirabilota bacterium]|nr:FlgD immunoglobulin-like domain containing protein [Methylomirabilota bacterium]